MTTDMFRKIEKCRVCGNVHYDVILDLGDQHISGVFPNEEGAAEDADEKAEEGAEDEAEEETAEEAE